MYCGARVMFRVSITYERVHLYNGQLTATVDPFFPTPPVNITEAFANAKTPDINTAIYRGKVLTSMFPNGSYNQIRLKINKLHFEYVNEYVQ